MERSIETIWKEGFLQSDALVAPKVNNLYTQKSHHLVDKFKRMFSRNITYVIILAFVHLGICLIAGIPVIGAVLFLLFIPLIIACKQEMRKMEDVDSSLSSYQFLKTFDTRLKSAIKRFGKIYQVFYPIYFPSIVLGIAFTNFFGKEEASIIEKIMNDPGTSMMYGLPILWVAALAFLMVVAAIFSQKLGNKRDQQLDVLFANPMK